MTLVITLLAAAVATAVWYARPAGEGMRFDVLAFAYWGAALMWSVDGIASLAEGGPFVEVSDTAVMFDDAVLGLLVLTVGLAAWALWLVVSDPKGKLSRLLKPARS